MSPTHVCSCIRVANPLILLSVLSALSTVSAIRKSDCPISPFFTPNFTPDRAKADLKVLVPNITTLRQFVDCSSPPHVRGFCIDVFEMALSILIPAYLSKMSVHYTCFNFSTQPNATGPTYNDMIDFVANGTYDAVVGDVTIGAHRLSKVDFTHQYMESGVVILTKVGPQDFSPWLFFGLPFSLRMWCTIMGAFVVTGLLVCLLDHNHHPEFGCGRIRQRIDKMFWFTIETLVLLDKESVKSSGARVVMVAWVFFVFLLSASYTAGLSSFLTANSLSIPSQDVTSLRESREQLGYRRGSIVRDILMARFQIPAWQLKPIRTVAEFVNNMTRGPEKGGVLAIVDESPYVNIFFSNLSSSTCDFAITGPPLTSEGFGFGFNKARNLAANFSVAVLNLTESGCLQDLQEKYNLTKSNACATSSSYSTRVTWRSSLALFIPFFGALALCVFVHCVKPYVCTRRTLQNESMNAIPDDSISCMFNGLRHRRPQEEVELLALSS